MSTPTDATERLNSYQLIHMAREAHNGLRELLSYVTRMNELLPKVRDTMGALDQKVSDQQRYIESLELRLADVVRPLDVDVDGPSPPDEEPQPAESPLECRGFHWVGQSWEHCDQCGRPWQEHEGMVRPAPGAGPFSNETIIVPWSGR
jgi:hypothetical protein